MGARLNLIGECFGRLTVKSEAKRLGTRSWLCLCECGNEVNVITASLKCGATRSCGCLMKDKTVSMNKKRTVSWDTSSRTYISWKSMKARCLNKNGPDYKNYGGRGITVCDEWLGFEAFLSDMGERPDGLTIDRIDNDLGYCKENCKWSTIAEQNRNKRGLVNV